MQGRMKDEYTSTVQNMTPASTLSARFQHASSTLSASKPSSSKSSASKPSRNKLSAGSHSDEDGAAAGRLSAGLQRSEGRAAEGELGSAAGEPGTGSEAEVELQQQVQRLQRDLASTPPGTTPTWHW